MDIRQKFVFRRVSYEKNPDISRNSQICTQPNEIIRFE